MYSLIFMTAMAGTPDVASFGYGTGCTGCAGYSYSYASYSYSSCGGCAGPRFPLLHCLATPFRRMASCYGSSCYGSGCYSTYLYSPSYATCMGSCYGSSCYGSSCYGSSCYGSCYGSSCVGCFGSCYGCIGSAPVIYEGGPVIGPGAVTPVPTVGVPLSEAPGEHYGVVALSGAKSTTVVAARPTVSVEAGDAPAPASLSVELPADAKLYVDGQLIAGSGESRQFHTPELARGQAYFYEVKAEVAVGGQTVTEEKRVVVKAGESLRESFPKLIASVKAANEPAVASK